MKTILFDFDGVLYNTFNLHLEKLREFTGYPISEEEYRSMHNGNFYSHDIEALKKIDWLKYRDYVRECFENLTMEKTIFETLTELSKKKKLFVISSGDEHVICQYLENNGVRDIFLEILGSKFAYSKIKKFEYVFKKYFLEKNESIFVTDTLGDILEANEFGLKTIAVDFGFHLRETLEKGNPEMIISHFRELIFAIE
ncbi:MAG: HAD family hydrolase [Candidatus Moraniibacteriota bacterium]|nr:MAG: HAD family hydrolase [Candidatus Moranbacteria bacterium]